MRGQDVPTLRQGNTEIGGFIGGGYGLGVSGSEKQQGYTASGTSLHLMGGADAGYAVTKSLFVVGEASYFPSLGQATVKQDTGGYTFTDTFDRKIFEFNGGIHYRLPVPESRFVPYLVVGAGAVHFPSAAISQSATKDGCTGSNCVTTAPNGTAGSQTSAAVDFGAGARLYVTEHFGFRGEFRFFRPFGLDNLTSFYRIAGGVFFQLK